MKFSSLVFIPTTELPAEFFSSSCLIESLTKLLTTDHVSVHRDIISNPFQHFAPMHHSPRILYPCMRLLS